MIICKWNFCIHSELLIQRNYKVMKQMSNWIYAFGGWNPLGSHTDAENTSEFLPNTSDQWQPGPSNPYDTRVILKSALAISKNELVLKGGGVVSKVQLEKCSNTKRIQIIGQ